MNIHNAVPFIQPLAGEAQVSGVEKASNASTPSLVSSASDDAHLSGAASLANQAASLPDVRSDKVAAIQQAIAEGSYHVSASDVAQSLMGHMFNEKE